MRYTDHDAHQTNEPKMSHPLSDDRFKTLALKQHLTPLERIELDDILLQRQTTALNAKRTGLAGARRKEENRLKYRIGAIAVSAGLSDFTDDELTAAFAVIAASTPQQRALYKARGETIRRAKQPLTGNFHV